MNHTTDTQRGADGGAGRVYSLMVCRVCGADSLDEVCPECRQPFSSPYGNGCAICTEPQRGADGESRLIGMYVAAKSEIVRLEAELSNAQGLLDEWQSRADAAEQAIGQLRASRRRYSTSEVHIGVYDWQRFERAADRIRVESETDDD